MDHSTKPGKRLVTKGEFVANTGKKAVLSSFGAGVFLLGIVAIAITLVKVLPRIWDLPIADAISEYVGIGMLGGFSFALIWFGRRAVKEGKAIDAGVPLTRANTGDLPAIDSLVRASEEPIQGQEAILLRAAQLGQGTPPEQMVRASTLPETSESATLRRQ